MATFVLVHGAWQAGWCWRDVIPRLRVRGHEAIALDLPGHGADRTPLHAVTMASYVNAIVAAFGGASERPILVCHSAAGAASQAAETASERLAAIVYVAGVLPANGTALLDIVDGFDPEYLAQFSWAPDRRSAGISPEGARAYLYPLCPPDRVEDAIPRMTPEPVGPYEAPLFTTARAASVPAYYVGCLRDRVVSRETQRTMQERARARRVFEIDCDHSPFFSSPDELVAALDQVAKEAFGSSRPGRRNGTD